jgi:hypothetical protein
MLSKLRNTFAALFSAVENTPEVSNVPTVQRLRMDLETKSHLLNAMEALDEGLWGQFLLPKLLANKTAAAFASSCRC